MTRRSGMILTNKNAVLYGVGDSLGGAVALAEAGARVFVTARRLQNARKVVDEICAVGGLAEANQVDALEETAVKDHADHVVASAGTIDISFNLINLGERQGTPLVEMLAEDFVRPVRTAMLTRPRRSPRTSRPSWGRVAFGSSTSGRQVHPTCGPFGKRLLEAGRG
jgi:3-oxoacyl-[acyl-carrier protein] reductase